MKAYRVEGVRVELTIELRAERIEARVLKVEGRGVRELRDEGCQVCRHLGVRRLVNLLKHIHSGVQSLIEVLEARLPRPRPVLAL